MRHSPKQGKPLKTFTHISPDVIAGIDLFSSCQITSDLNFTHRWYACEKSIFNYLCFVLFNQQLDPGTINEKLYEMFVNVCSSQQEVLGATAKFYMEI
jgi:hypothetical protein